MPISADLIDRIEAHLKWENVLQPHGVPLRAATNESSTPGGIEAAPGALKTNMGGPDTPAKADRITALKVLAEQASECTQCVLHSGRTKSVFARGSANADLVFVGEGPGYHEDQQGVPFVGQAGQLLDKMIVAMGLKPDDVYICNVVKCRPPENRTPLPPEVAACSPYLKAQILIVQPKVMVALGRCAAEALSATQPGGKNWRGQWTTWENIPLMSTYHPAFLLRSPQYKRPVWEDLQKVMQKLK